jgi:hypothetical protein
MSPGVTPAGERRGQVPEAAARGKGTPGCCVSWLIVGLLGLVFLGGLLLFIWGRGRSRPAVDDTLVTDLLGPPDRPAVAVRARREGVPSPASEVPGEGRPAPAQQAGAEGQLSPAPRARAERRPSPAPRAREKRQRAPAPRTRAEGRPSPAPQASGEGQPSAAVQASGEDQRSPVPPAPPATEENWLETQLAWINAWSQRMNQRITPTDQPESGSKD